MRKDVEVGCVGVSLGGCVEGIARCGIEGWGGPFSLGFEKERKGVAANMYGVGDGVLDAWASGLAGVCAREHEDTAYLPLQRRGPRCT